MKTYVITLSKKFPATHPRKGEPTYFWERFSSPSFTRPKLHTIRANFDLWYKRFEKIAAGEACLSVREWTGAPYRSKQKELARLTHEDGIGIQKLQLEVADKLFGKYHAHIDDGCGTASIFELATNDGLSPDDWLDWFKAYDKTKPLAIIHFTPFRY